MGSNNYNPVVAGLSINGYADEYDKMSPYLIKNKQQTVNAHSV